MNGAGLRVAPWALRVAALAVAVLVVVPALPALPALPAGPAAAAPSSLGQAPAEAIPTLEDGYGLHVTAETQLDPRLLAVTVSTAALPDPANVRILLPTGYASHPDERYPVLYLLDGTSGTAADWTTMGDAEQTTAGLPLIVVMPDITLNGDGGGWCADWVNGGAYGPPEWETFHIDELIPWVDANFRTIADRDGRAIAGLSQGGFCSMSYAAQFPDLFVTALSYSGAPDIAYDPEAEAGAMAVINATEVGLDGVPPDSIFGSPVTDQINWAAHDPATLADNLRGMNLLLYNGNGLPGPLDANPVNPEASSIEALVDMDTTLFHNRLDALGIPSYWDDYGPGTHTWPYWARDLQESIGAVMDGFAHPPPPPAQITYTSAAAQYTEFGWQVAINRPAEEFSTLENADSEGFSLAGSGSGVVTTPPYYRPGARLLVTMRGDAGDTTEILSPDAQGQLQLVVPLGPGNPYQQDTVQADLFGTQVYTTSVQIVSSPG
jgi:S-formylglutathione hydrolase FrmB